MVRWHPSGLVVTERETRIHSEFTPSPLQTDSFTRATIPIRPGHRRHQKARASSATPSTRITPSTRGRNESPESRLRSWLPSCTPSQVGTEQATDSKAISHVSSPPRSRRTADNNEQKVKMLLEAC